MNGRKLKFGWRWAGALVLLVLLTGLGLRYRADGRLHVYFLDVGQGDAIFVRAPEGQQILIDGGPSPSALLDALGELMPFWDRDIDLLVLTHPDADHMDGLLPFLERYRVQTMLYSAALDRAPEAAEFRTRLEKSVSVTAYAWEDMRLPYGEMGVTVLHAPGKNPTPGRSDNDGSIVLRIDYGKMGVLLTGDAEAGAEAALLAGGLPLRADVLKVAHHGSSSSTSPDFLAAVRPSLAVIQVGADNRFGHPSPALLDRLGTIPVLRTDRNGRIEVISDGERLWYQSER